METEGDGELSCKLLLLAMKLLNQGVYNLYGYL